MAIRGRPLPIPIRQQIREYREKRISERRTAILLGIHRDTVRKYLKQVCTTREARAGSI